MKLRVLIVDDSSFVRELLRAGLAGHADLEIVGEAGDGQTAERLVAQLRPDVVTMDVVMPLVSGIDAIRSIMTRVPTPIVVVADARGGVDRLVMEAMGAGAVEVYVKPQREFDQRAAAELAEILRAAARARSALRLPPSPTPETEEPLDRIASASVIGVVASTGGPPLLNELVRSLPPRFSIPVAIVQHTAHGFSAAFVSWLGEASRVPVTLAKAGTLARGVVVAPDDYHLEIKRHGEVSLHRAPPVRSHRPSGSVLLESLATFGRGAVGIVCSGMGDDGASGLAGLEAAGGLAIVQDPRTAVIDSMPRAAIQATRTPLIATIPRIAELLRRAVGAP